MLTTDFKDHYLVLGVSRTATADELKKAYRAKAKEVHPDLLGPDATEDERREAHDLSSELSRAYDCLSDPAKRTEIDRWLVGSRFGSSSFDDFWSNFSRNTYTPPRREPIVVPEPEAVEFDGVWCWIEYEASPWSDILRATVRVPLADIFRINEFGELPHQAWLTEVVAVDTKGDIVGRGYSLSYLRNEIRKLQAEARRNVERREWNAQLDQLEAQCQRLAREQRPIDHLERLISKARFDIKSGSEGWWKTKDRSTIIRSIREVEKEIDRVQNFNPSELLLTDLLSGTIEHPDVAWNKALLQRLDVLSFRSGGEVTVPTEDEIKEHYRKRLGHLRTQREVLRANLRLEDDTPVIMELAAEGALSLAPETIELQGNKGRTAYPVTYGRARIGDESVPAGLITVPESVYSRLGAEHGKASRFPGLPYGITLVIRVRVRLQNNELLTDPYPDGKSLQNEVRRCQARLRNPKPQEEISLMPTFWEFPY